MLLLYIWSKQLHFTHDKTSFSLSVQTHITDRPFLFHYFLLKPQSNLILPPVSVFDVRNICTSRLRRQREETSHREEVEFSSCVLDGRSADTAASLMWQQCTQQERSYKAILSHCRWRELHQLNLCPLANTHQALKHTCLSTRFSPHNHSCNPLCQRNRLVDAGIR